MDKFILRRFVILLFKTLFRDQIWTQKCQYWFEIKGLIFDCKWSIFYAWIMLFCFDMKNEGDRKECWAPCKRTQRCCANNPNIVWCYILCSCARNAAYCCVSWKWGWKRNNVGSVCIALPTLLGLHMRITHCPFEHYSCVSQYCGQNSVNFSIILLLIQTRS